MFQPAEQPQWLMHDERLIALQRALARGNRDEAGGRAGGHRGFDVSGSYERRCQEKNLPYPPVGGIYSACIQPTAGFSAAAGLPCTS
jgi:hypothetical protein